MQEDIPTLLPSANFDPIADAQTLRDAMAGIGTNESAIIQVLCYRVASQRATITETYNRQFGAVSYSCVMIYQLYSFRIFKPHGLTVLYFIITVFYTEFSFGFDR